MSLHDLHRSWWEELVKILAHSSTKSLPMTCVRGACMKALVRCFEEVLLQRSGRILSIAGPSMMILRDSLRCLRMKLLWSRSCRSPCEKICWRSWWHLEIGPCMKILQMPCTIVLLAMKDPWSWGCSCRKLFWGALGKFLYEDLLFLWRSCEVLLKVLAWSSWSRSSRVACEKIL